MSELVITNKKEKLQTLFTKIKEVYYDPSTTFTPSNLATMTYELPILSDGVSFDTGKPSVTKVKLTTGDTWFSISEAGDPSINFQVSSVKGSVDAIFLNAEGAAETPTVTIGEKSFTAQGYTTAPKKVTGCLLLLSEDHKTAIFLPSVEMYGSLKEEQSKGAYFDVDVTPVLNSAGVSIYILEPGA
jgi:hypothetical protein